VGSTAWFFGTGTNHKIYVRDLHRSWQRFNPDGECLGGPGATVSGGVLTVACQGFDHRLYYSVANAGAGLPTAHGWTALGGRLAAGPAVGAPSGVVTFYAVGGGTGTGVYTRTATTGWTRRPGRCEDSPAVASDGALAYVACHGLNGGLYYAPTTAATFGNYTNLNGLLVGGPGVAVTSEGLLFCVEGRNGDLYLRTPTGPYVNDGAGPVDGAAIAGLT
jgi:hypothetical protein